MNILRASLLVRRANTCDFNPSFSIINKRIPKIRFNSINLHSYHTQSLRLSNDDIQNKLKKSIENTREKGKIPPYNRIRPFRIIKRLIKIIVKFIWRIFKRRNPLARYEDRLSQTVFDDYEDYFKSEQERYAQEELYQLKRSMLREVKARNEDVQKISEEFQNKALRIILNNYEKELKAVEEYSGGDENAKTYSQEEIDKMMKDIDTDDNIINKYISEEELNKLISELHVNIINTYGKSYAEKTIEDEMFEGRKQQRVIIEEEKQKQREEEKARKQVEEEEERQRKLKEEEEEKEGKKEGKKKKKKVEDEDLEIKDTDDESTIRRKKLLKEQREEERKKLRERSKNAMKLLKSSIYEETAKAPKEKREFVGVLYDNLNLYLEPFQFISYSNNYLTELSIEEWDPLYQEKRTYKHGVKSQLLNKDREVLVNPSVWIDEEKNEIYAMSRGGYICKYKTDRKVFSFDSKLDNKVPHYSGKGEIFSIPYVDDQLIFFELQSKKIWIIKKFDVLNGGVLDPNDLKYIEFPQLYAFKPFTVKDKLYVIGINDVLDLFYTMYSYNFEEKTWEEVKLNCRIPHRSFLEYTKEFSKGSKDIFERDIPISITKSDDEAHVYMIVPHIVLTFVFDFNVEESKLTWTKTPAPPLFYASSHFDDDKLLIVGGMIEDTTSHVISYFDIETKKWELPVQYGLGDPIISHHALFKIAEGKYGTIGGIIIHKDDTSVIEYGRHVQPSTSQYIILTIPDEDEYQEENAEEESKEEEKEGESKSEKEPEGEDNQQTTNNNKV